MLILEINDVEITLTRDGETLYREPGAAYVDKDGALFGRQALAQSRLHPRQSHNQFWQRLNADPVAPPGRGVANQADLVYLHLVAIRAAANLRERNDLVVAAPPTATTQQLAMLLGIAAEAGFHIRAFVDASVAAASQLADEAGVSLLDVALQRAFVARLEARSTGDGTAQMQRTGLNDVPAAGFAALLEGWIDAVADRFVEGTRFDPLRIAETEQQVFDQVLAGIERNEVEYAIDVEHEGVSRHVNVGSRAFAAKSEQRYGLLANAIGATPTLAITDRVRRLPGLAAFLQRTHDLIPLPANAVAAAIARHAELIFQPPASGAATSGAASGGARFVTALPLQDADPSQPSDTPPTHLLCGAAAIALGDGVHAGHHPTCGSGVPMFRVKRDESGATIVPDQDADVRLNGTRIDFQHRAKAGDRVTCGGTDFQLIAVVNAAPTG